MPRSLLKTKLYIPPVRPGSVPRPRLVERLNASWDFKLTLVSAPAGFGKTTLLSEWIEASGRAAAWISLDKGDNDLARFMGYLLAALQPIQPDACSVIQELLPDGRAGQAQIPVEHLLTTLVNEIGEIPVPFVLVLDDYHVITEPSVHEVVMFLNEHQPNCMHLVIAGRADPPWPLARLRAHREVNELRVNDLRFTTEEADTFFNSVMNLKLAREDVEALEDRTEGWVAGLQMAALSMQGRGNVREFIHAFTGSHHFISDFLVEEVLTQQPAEVRDFLLQTSILDRLTVPLCDAVTGRADAYEILIRLEQANLFLIPLDEERHWFRYHHLFRDLLQKSLEATQPGIAPLLHQRASRWYAAAEMYEDAVQHAMSGNDLELAADLVEKAASNVSFFNKQAVIGKWIAELPEAMVQSRPWLYVYSAWARYYMGQRDTVLKWLQAAEQALANRKDLTEDDLNHIQGHIAAIRSHFALTNQNIPDVLHYSQLALQLLPEGDEFRTETAVALGGAYWGLGDVVASEKAFSMGRSNALQTGSPSSAVPSACYVGMQQTKQGRLKDALETYQDALRYASTSAGRELPVAGFPNIKIGDLFREWNELDRAASHLERGVEQCVQLSQADVLADGYVGLARLQITLGQFEAAHETLRKVRELAQRTQIDPFVSCWLDGCSLRLWMAEGNLDAAIHWMQSSGMSIDGDLSYHYDLHHSNLARVLVERGIHEPRQPFLSQARALLSRLLVAAERASWVHDQIQIRVLQALERQASGDETSAVDALTAALRLAEPGGYIRVFVDEGERLHKLMPACQVHAGKDGRFLSAYMARICAAFPATLGIGESDEPGTFLQSTLNEPLTNRELEVLRLLPTSMTSEEIARALYVAPSTVRTHIKSIYGKLSANRRLEAVARARELGLL